MAGASWGREREEDGLVDEEVRGHVLQRLVGQHNLGFKCNEKSLEGLKLKCNTI